MKPTANSDSIQSELRAALQRFRGVFTVAAIFSMAINILMLVPSIYMLQLYDRVLASMNVTTLVLLTLVVLGLYAVMGALEIVRSKILIRVGSELDASLNKRLFQSIYASYLRQGNGNAHQALSDFVNLRQFATGQGVITFFDAPWSPVYLVILFIFHWQLGTLALTGAILLFGLTLFSEWATIKPLQEANRIAMRANAQTANSLRNAEVIEAMGMLGSLQQRWLRMHQSMLTMQALASERAGVISGVTRSVRIMLQSLVLGLGAWLVIRNEMTAGMMIAGSILMGRALAPVESMIGNWKSFVSARSAYDRIERLLGAYPAPPATTDLPAPVGNVSVENAFVTPPGAERPVLLDVSFKLAAGEALAVIGPSASGKSTLSRALLGIWPCQSGKIRLDGADVHAWDKARLGPKVGYLPQDVEIFEGTVAENIARFGAHDDQRIIAAARMAGVHEMILRLPKGYDTHIGEGGATLSGGQRQRIALARAVYGAPAIVVLDEPNSNLDDAGEKALLLTLQQLKAQGTSVVIVTHRTSAVAAVDKIMVLRDGRVAMFGARDDVLAALAGSTPTPMPARRAATDPA